MFCAMAAGLAPHRARQHATGHSARCNRAQRPRRTDSLFTSGLSAFDRSSAPPPGPGQVVWRQPFLKKMKITCCGPAFRPFLRGLRPVKTVSDLDFQPCHSAAKAPVPGPDREQRFPGTAVPLRALPEAVLAKFVVEPPRGRGIRIDRESCRPVCRRIPRRPFLSLLRYRPRLRRSRRSLNLCKTPDPAKLARA